MHERSQAKTETLTRTDRLLVGSLLLLSIGSATMCAKGSVESFRGARPIRAEPAPTPKPTANPCASVARRGEP